jgi:hypothetical protein
LRWKLSDGGVESGGGRLEALEMCLWVAVAKLVVSDQAQPFAQGIAQI